MKQQDYLPQWTRLHELPSQKFQSRFRWCLVAALLCCSTLYVWNQHWSVTSAPWVTSPSIAKFQECSIKKFKDTGFPFLDSASPLPVEEFIERRDRLARALVVDGVDAFIVEPGYTFQYYANISQPDWEVWEPEERPFLMIVQPQNDGSSGKIRAKTTFLAPSFEVARVKLLEMPFEEELEIFPWEEHWNPYETLRKSWKTYFLQGEESRISNSDPKIMVDEEMRDFIQRGLSENGFNVVGLGGEVEHVKQTKSPREVEIVRAVNTGTVEALRAMRECMYRGLTENEVMLVLDNTMRSAGMDPFFDIVLFDGHTTLPHGGTNGSQVLEAETFVLIDVGAHLYGYSSDICRTFFPPFFHKPTNSAEFESLPPEIREKIDVWDVVLEAQTQSMYALKSGNSAASVDIAARKVITDAGYGETFTHRVGHGIGIKAHESPYLNKGNTNVTLQAGMAFTSEPGVYIVGKFGVRHEDILLVKEGGEPEVLSGTRAIGPWDP